METVVKGDSRSLSIAAASIIAKVTRDRIMIDLAQDFRIPVATLMYWKTKIGKDRTGIFIGSRVMNDVRTRCLAVKEILQDGKEAKDIYEKYGVKHPQTVNRWVERYADTYDYFIDTLPDGVPWIAHEDKLAIGSVYDREVEILFAR